MKKTVTSLDAFKEDQTEHKIDASRKLKVAIIGTGWIAGAHMQEYKQMPDVEVVAAADLIPDKASDFMKAWGYPDARCYLSCHELLENEPELDAVSICTYNTQHAPCAIDALEHGVNVLLEKPFTVTLDEALDVMRAEKKSGKILSIHHIKAVCAGLVGNHKGVVIEYVPEYLIDLLHYFFSAHPTSP